MYILTNKNNTVLYTGVTSNLVQRIYQHKDKSIEGFTKTYNADKLVYLEEYETIDDAIKREKNIKAWKRDWKIQAIESVNKDWIDLYDKIH